jgi:hypothetical protein
MTGMRTGALVEGPSRQNPPTPDHALVATERNPVNNPPVGTSRIGSDSVVDTRSSEHDPPATGSRGGSDGRGNGGDHNEATTSRVGDGGTRHEASRRDPTQNMAVDNHTSSLNTRCRTVGYDLPTVIFPLAHNNTSIYLHQKTI